MTVILSHLLWVALYIIIFIILNICFIFINKNKFNNINNIKNNIILKILAVFILNKNLKTSLLISNNDVINYITNERSLNWPILNFIHTNLNNSIKANKFINNDNLNFKNKYNHYNFIKTNFNLNNILETNNLLTYQILLIILDKKFINNNLYKFLFNTLNQRFSITTSKILVKSFNLLKFQDYIQYCNLNLNNTNLIINNTNNLNLNKHIKITKIYNIINTKFNNNYYYYNTLQAYINKNLIKFDATFLNNLKSRYNISFSATNIVKYISNNSIKNSIILFLRKNKIFNKGRYSRNRQTYRTGAYWCLYVNIVAIIAFYFWFYKFTINFGYLWWLLYSFILSCFLPRALKHKFYNPKKIFIEYYLGIKWLINIILNILQPIYFLLINTQKLLFKTILIKLYSINTIKNYLNNDNFNLNTYIQFSFNWINKINNSLILIINNIIFK
uniref:Ymf67 n=1 Tax=Tetrahymena paravorax TaxID=5905 RepID=Q09F38_TETPR|nr:Ymf67 [Tetrahymena paravorax]ABI51704.1 Ymf67 [Tetrahymena paravorax]